MGRWDIDVTGVRAVLARVGEVGSEFEAQMRGLDVALDGAIRQSSSDIVAAALAGFAQARTSSIEFVFSRTSACLNAAAQATNAYVLGDLEMAANAQAAATSAPEAVTMPGRPGGGALPR